MTPLDKQAYLALQIDKIKAGIELTAKEYDALIDAGFDIDYTVNGSKVVAIKKRERGMFENGYTKKYPVEKRKLYENIVSHLVEKGWQFLPPLKENFRDFDIKKDNEHYHITIVQNKNK